MTPQLSVIIPCYNEADTIEPMLRAWSAVLSGSLSDFEILVVNDGSIDGTGRTLDKCRKELRHLRVIHQLNSGPAGALRRGAEAARCEYVLLVTVDPRYEPADFLRMWEVREGAIQVLAQRTHRVEGLVRRLFTEALVRIGRWIFKVSIADPTTGFRLLRREYLESYLQSLPRVESLLCALSYVAKRDYPERVLEIPIHFGKQKGLRRRRRFLEELAKATTTLAELLRLKAAPILAFPALKPTRA